jgi:hypothetical protein
MPTVGHGDASEFRLCGPRCRIASAVVQQL